MSPNSNYSTKQTKSKGVSPAFTIVELLIVVVVIAILAAITIVSYNGITKSAKETALKSDLRNAATQLEITRATTSSYPTDKDDLKFSKGTESSYSGDINTFCLQASNPSLPDKTFHITEAGSIEEGNCPPPHIQTITSSQCSALPIYTGTNSDAVHTVIDTRGGTTRNYEIAKLADGNCWMLTNLKLGSTTGSITLTPADSNVSSNFTLPQLTTSGSSSHDIPRAYGPVPGDTGTGSTNYGYLYNWPAATAGETTSSITTGNASHSICPAGWRLPTGGAYNSGEGEFADLDIAFGGTGMVAWNNEPNIARWNYTGPLKGALSGFWDGGFFV